MDLSGYLQYVSQLIYRSWQMKAAQRSRFADVDEMFAALDAKDR